MVPYIRQYLADRERHLKEQGKQSNMLFPNVYVTATEGRYSISKFNEIKREVEQQAGVRFLIKDFRSSSATDALDRDPRALSMISTQMGHKHEATTQDHYARIKQGRAGEELRKLLNPVQEAPRNELKTTMPGPMSQAKSTKRPVIRSEIGQAG
jgi:integrase